ncbi:hypothetical protein V6N12_041996 [Hibiscus sabdariffa]|uniref:Defensin-like protein 263 n=1 Tax=Hibiscus sabdariffa TaxID=183260 RepID=A0ABR2EDG9_9ROSI
MHSFGVASLLIILIVASCVSNSTAIGRKCSSNKDCNIEELCICHGAGNCSCQEKIAAKIVYHQCKKDHDCDKMVEPSCKPGCKPACLDGLCICKC